MRCFICLLFFSMIEIAVYAQNQIPEKITTDLVLKPQAKPYTSSGFTLEKGATLTILPGVKVTMSLPKEVKSFQIAYAHSNININGTLIIGSKVPGKSAPVVFDGSSPRLFFKDAKLEINGWEVTAALYQFTGDNNGYIKNVNFYIEQPTIPSVAPSIFSLAVPKTGNLTISDCLIDDQGIDIVTTDFPNDLDRLTITKCALTSKFKDNKLRQNFMPITMFAYATKCDCYVEISYKAFDWPLKKTLSSEWFVSDDRAKKSTSESAKSLKGFDLKLATKPFTSFKQEVVPPAKEEKK